jgi:tetratricopeptide (TPR) repeat protein
MLETIRAYAAERFAPTADGEAVRERHYRFFLALAQRHGSDRALMGADRQEHLSRLDVETDNLQAALAWALDQPSAGQALAMCVALGQYWWMRNRYDDAVNWIDLALSMPGADTHLALRVRVLCSKALALFPQGRNPEQSAALAEAESIALALGDPLILSQTLELRSALGGAAGGDLDVAAAIADEALDFATATEDDWAIAMAVFAKAKTAPTIAELRERVDRAAALLDQAGNMFFLAALLSGSAYVALCMGSDRDAKELVDRATPLTRALDDPYLSGLMHGNAGMAALLTGDTNAAHHAFREELVLSRDIVSPRSASEGLKGLAAVAAVRNDAQRAARLAGAAATQRDDAPQDEVEARLDAAFIQPARTRHGTEPWDAAARDGSTLSLEDAIAYALQEPRT